MTPKEKAKQLVDKYLNTVIHFPYIDTEDGNCIGTGYMTHQSAIRCALIVVDEMIESTTDNWSHSPFWQQVRKEIESL